MHTGDHRLLASELLVNPPSSGPLAFSLRLASFLPVSDSPAPPTGSSASPSLALFHFPTEDVWQRCNQFIETAEFLIRVSPSQSYNADRVGLGWMSGWSGGDVFAACSDCAVGRGGGEGGRGGNLSRRSGIQVDRLYSRPSPAMY
jgi:hypothetical protein